MTSIDPMAAVKVLREALAAMQSSFSREAWESIVPRRHINAWDKGDVAMRLTASIEQPASEPMVIVPDWPFCNPACDYEDPHGGMHDSRSAWCLCEAAKASIARQRAAAPQALPATEREKAGEPDVRDVALAKINAIRNSIIGLQSLNWSEHVYPLVAALDEAGIEGMEYPEARKYFGTLLERAVAAEDKLAAISPAKPDLSALISKSVDSQNSKNLENKPDLSGLTDAEILATIEVVRDQGNFHSLAFPTDAATIAFARAILATHPDAQAKPDASDIDAENLRIGQEIQRAAGTLPPEWELEITIECGAGLVSLRDNEGQTMFFEDNSDGISYNIKDAINLAIAATTSKPNADPTTTGEADVQN